jgi:aryl-phospho-beta-D-glucosidase BglC (GH1 family)
MTVITIPPFGSAQIKIKFTPTVSGDRTGSLSFTSNTDSSPHNIPLKGKGRVVVPEPIFGITPTVLGFPDTQAGNSSANVSATLRNTGTLPLNIVSIVASGEFSLVGSAPLSIAVGATVVIQLKFSPLTLGAKTGSLTVTTNAANSPHVIAMSGMAVAATPQAHSWLTTQGRLLKDAGGNTVRLRSCNWYGGESILLPMGLWSKPYKTVVIGGVTTEGLLDTVARLGFNSVRLPICEDVTWAGRKPNTSGAGWDTTYIRADLNPDLFNGPNPATQPQPTLTSIEIYDKVIAHCATLGLRVVLDMHCLAPNDDNVAGANGRWYSTATPGSVGATGGNRGEARSEAQLVAAWSFLATRYKDNPTVCGFDLINEPYNSTWDNDPMNGVAALYERLGAVIHAINPNVLLICEGVAGNVRITDSPILEYGAWWSGKLDLARARPLVMTVPNKVVYSPHEYGSYLGGNSQLWFSDPTYPANLPGVWSKMWGYLAEENIAPIWVGEFGSTMKAEGVYTQAFADKDALWLAKLAEYYEANQINFAYWALNPPGEPNGILAQSPAGVWGDPYPYKVTALQPFLFPTPPVSTGNGLLTEDAFTLTAEDGSRLITEQ